MNRSFSRGFLRPIKPKVSVSNYLTPLPPPVPVPWIRPSDWPDIGSPATNTIQFLVADTTLLTYAFVIVCAGGTYTVNWGDGITDSDIASSATAQHTYTLGAGTACSRGYTTFKIIITATVNITQFVVILHSLVSNNQEHGYLDAEFNVPSLTSIANAFCTSGQSVFCRMLEHLRFNSSMPGVTSINGLALSCNGLQLVEGLLFPAATTATNAFNWCCSLSSVDISNMPLLVTASNMFDHCYNLDFVDLTKQIALATTTSMFSYCYRLTSIKITPRTFALVTSAGTMFQNCAALSSIDISSMVGLVTASNMFIGCTTLKSIDLTGINLIQTCNYMFSNCANLRSVTLGSLAAVNGSALAMFNGCYNLESVDISTMTGATIVTSLFNTCYRLKTVVMPPANAWAAITDVTTIFNLCYELESIDLSCFGAAVVTATNMFQDCKSIKTIDASMLTGVVTATGMFTGCYSLESVNITGLVNIVTATSMFSGCFSLTSITGLANLGSSAASVYGTTMFNNCPNLTSIALAGAKLTKIGAAGTAGKLNHLTALSWHASSLFGGTASQLIITYCFFTAAQLDTLFATLPPGAKTIQITGCPGATNWSQSNQGTTAGSPVVTSTATGNLVVGYEIVGTGISTAVAVTLQAAGNTVTRNAHGLSNGTIVYFATLVTTTGIIINTPYYVINASTNTFQLSLTLGGGVIDLLTGDGSGTIVYSSTILSINPNVSYTLSAPASATGTVTLIQTARHAMIAIGKGWTVVN